MLKCVSLHQGDRDVFTIVPGVALTMRGSHNEDHFDVNVASLLADGQLPVAILPGFQPPLDITVTFGDRTFGPDNHNQLVAAVDGGIKRGLRYLDLREATVGGSSFTSVQVGQGDAQLRASIKSADVSTPLLCKVRPAHSGSSLR